MKKIGGEKDEGDDVFLLFLVQAGGDEFPELVEHVRRDGEQRRQERDLDVEHEGLGQRPEGQLFPFGQELGQGDRPGKRKISWLKM